MSVQNFPHNAAILRFGMKTPFWPLTTSYGMFTDPNLRMHFVSPEHYLGYHMLTEAALRESIMSAPNGYIAYRTLSKIMEDTPDAVSPNWPSIRIDVMRTCIRLKYGQSSMAYDLLLKTGMRPIYDDSRDDPYWCYTNARGLNKHGELLEEFRAEARQKDPRFAS